MFASPDPQEAELLTTAAHLYAAHAEALSAQGYPAWLAASEARQWVCEMMGIDLYRYRGYPPFAMEPGDEVGTVRDLSVRYDLEHDGSALTQLLAQYDYQWQTTHGEWQLTPGPGTSGWDFSCQAGGDGAPRCCGRRPSSSRWWPSKSSSRL